MTTTDAGTQATPQTTPQRDPWFDNAKFLLVTLVVLGHAWTLSPPEGVRDWPYDALYLWHVPAFVLITGYLSRRFTWSHARMFGLLRTVVVPYLIFEGVYALFRIYVGGVEMRDLWLNPHWPMWYLAALFFWRLLTPIFLRIPHPVLVSLVISVVAGAFATDTLDNARILGLLPFFVMGLHLPQRLVEWLHTRTARLWAIAIMVGMVVLGRFNDTLWSTEWLYYRSHYSELESSNLQAAGIRVALLIIGTLGALAALSLVSSSRRWYTTLGSASLVVYLFHGFFILAAEYAGFVVWGEQHPVASFVIVTPLALVLAVVLASPPVARVLNRVVDPVGAIIRAREKRRPTAPTSG